MTRPKKVIDGPFWSDQEIWRVVAGEPEESARSLGRLRLGTRPLVFNAQVPGRTGVR